jgi:hypothetical protein
MPAGIFFCLQLTRIKNYVDTKYPSFIAFIHNQFVIKNIIFNRYNILYTKQNSGIKIEMSYHQQISG